jgi:CheY-like chemotaxis protein
MTSGDERGQNRRCILAGMDAAVTKPLVPSQLGRAIEDVLTEHRLPR